MNILPKGTLTVIVATMIASTLILINGKSVADSVEKTVEVVSSEITIKKPADVASKIIEQNSIKKGDVTTSTSLPPPGPFMIANPVGEGLSVRKDRAKSLLEPILKLSKPKIKKAPVSNKRAIQPKLSSTAPEFKREQPSIPMGPVGSLLAPTLKQIAPEQPKREISNLAGERKNLEVPSQPKQLAKSNAQPIWMQKPPINTSIQPARPSAGNIRKQQYIYVPVPMYQSNYPYPQMPPGYENYYYPPVANFGIPQAPPVSNNSGSQQKVPNTQKLNIGVTK